MPKGDNSRKITLKEYREIVRGHATNLPISEIAQRLGVQDKVVKKYIEYGDEGYGWLPAKDIVAEAIQISMLKDSIDVADKIRAYAPIAESVQHLFIDYLQHLRDNPEEKIKFFDNLTKDPSKLVKSIDTVLRLHSFALGGPDKVTESRDGESKFKGLTEAQLKKYIELGIQPSDQQYLDDDDSIDITPK